MKKLTVFAAIPVAFMLMTGCATVKIYSDAGLKNETGLRFYTLKPFLLVEYMAEKDKTIKTSVVYLPDLSDPQFMVLKPGVGSSELKMAFKNSALESYGVATDSQLPESMEAFAAMLSKSAYAAQAFEGAPPYAPSDEGEHPTDLGATFRLFEIMPGPSGSTLKEVVLAGDKNQGL